MTLPVLTVAVVGHTNTGKTSLLRTLLRDVNFGEVSDRPATTRSVSGTVLLIDGKPSIELYDTPGLEDSISLLERIDDLRSERRCDPIELIQKFLQSVDARGRFSQEAKALRQLLKSDVGLYIIDARDRPLPKHRDELTVLAMCARPIVPVLNFTAHADARASDWRDQLSRLNLHAVAEFDTVVVDEQAEQRLFETMRTLLDRFRPTLDAIIADRRRQREQLVSASAALISDMLIDTAAVTLEVRSSDRGEVVAATGRLRELVRQREQRCVRELLELHRFHSDDCAPDVLPLENGRWGLDLFSPEALKQFGIRTGSAAAAGAMAGLAIDVAVGGMTLGAATATGAAIGAAISAGHSHGRRLLNRLRGTSELRCDQTTLHLLAARQIDLCRALLTRGHAAQQRLKLTEAKTADSQRRSPAALPALLRRAQTKPTWSSLGTSDTQSRQRRAISSLAQAGRESAVHELAELIRPLLQQDRSQPTVLTTR